MLTQITRHPVEMLAGEKMLPLIDAPARFSLCVREGFRNRFVGQDVRQRAMHPRCFFRVGFFG